MDWLCLVSMIHSQASPVLTHSPSRKLQVCHGIMCHYRFVPGLGHGRTNIRDEATHGLIYITDDCETTKDHLDMIHNLYQWYNVISHLHCCIRDVWLITTYVEVYPVARPNCILTISHLSHV